MKTKRIILTALICLTSILGMQAQGGIAFQAYPDNAFINPDADYFKSIDVLANDHYYFDRPNDCDRDGIVITVLVNGTIGWAEITSDNQVEYRPFPGQSGPDKIEYQIKCPSSGETSSATIYINVNDQPNMISDKDCYIDPIGIGFEMELLASSRNATRFVDPASYVIAGDVDGDGDIEILVESHPGIPGDLNPHHPNNETYRILICGYNKATNALTLKYSIQLPFPASGFFPQAPHRIARAYPFGQLAIAKITGGGVNAKSTPSIFYVNTNNACLFRYDFNPATNDFEETWRSDYWSDNFAYLTMSPNVTDLMGDGNQQIVLGNKIFNADTGTLLATAMDGATPIIPPNNAKSNYGLGLYGHTTLNGFSAYPNGMVVIDIDDDGIQEVIGGDCVYKVNITNYNSSTGNQYKFHLRAKNANHAGISDGATAVADINNDGKLDIIVAGPTNGINLNNKNACLYVYNPRTGDIMHTNNINNIPRGQDPGFNYGPSRPFIGDIDGDGYPEICLSSYNVLRAYDLDNTNTLKMKWNLPTTDISSSTTLSMFDFAQDKQARMVYRDEDNLRIIRSDNTTPITEVTVSGIGSPTVNEYPIIVDINGDGHAEIITIGANPKRIPNPMNPSTETWNWDGTIQVYAAKGEKKWAPARPVWHQNSYNPLFINDDLTIPAKPISPATAFISPNGQLDRPFNNFLQQATDLNKEGLMIMLGPDLLFDSRMPKRITIDDNANTLHVSVGIMNQGDAAFTGPIKLQMYAYTKANDQYRKVGAPFFDPNAAGLGYKSTENTRELSYTIPNKTAELALGYDNLFMTINLNTDPSEVPQFDGNAECHEGINNFTSGFSLVSGSRVICEGDSETITIAPKNTYDIKWYASAKGGTPIALGDLCSVTKNADIVQYLFVEAYRLGGSTPITQMRDTVFIYKTPDSLIWNGSAENKDWHDFKNWKNPNLSYPEVANIPRTCTNVLIPTGISNYPDLAPKTNFEATDYLQYFSSECNNIHYAFGSETVRPDKLVYTRAYVDLIFNAHRWQMFAPPLKDFYTGDIYRKNIIPFHDDVKTYTKFWSRRNPSNNYYTSGWTQLFQKPDVSFEAGQGLGVWISDKAIEGQINPPRDPFDFSFPKYDLLYRIYLADTDIPAPGFSPYTTDRTNSHRFIFDGTAEGTDFNLKIDGEVKTVGQMVLVGNPFMAHLDFDKFYTANSAYIQNYYSILDENAMMQYYNKGASTLGKNIAPMQAFLVEIKTPFTNLKANGMMTLTMPGENMKSGASSSDDFQLKITASQAGHANQAFIQFSTHADNDYRAGEDIAGLFPTKASSDSRAVSLYSLTDNGIKVAVNKLKTDELKNRQIPLGVWSSKTEPITINISNIDKIPSGYTLYLYDKLLKQSHNLETNSMMTFGSVELDQNSFLDGRFFLQFKEETSSSIDQEELLENITVFAKNNVLHLIGSNDFQAVEVYNLHGQLLHTAKPNTNVAECRLPYANIYIVKIKTDKQVVAKKILNQQ